MRNITVRVQDDVYRAARVRAAEDDTSVSALVSEYLVSLSSEAVEFTRLEAKQKKILGGIVFRADERIDREKLHERSVR